MTAYSMPQFMNDLYDYRRIILIVVVSLCVILGSTLYMIWSTMIEKQLHYIQNSTFFTNAGSWWLMNSSNKNNNKNKSGTTNLPPKDPFRMIRCPLPSTTIITDDNNNKNNTDNNHKHNTSIPQIQMLTLNPDFISYCHALPVHPYISPPHSVESVSSSSSSSSSPPCWNVMSLGEYISSLRPYFSTVSMDSKSSSTTSSLIPNWLEGEIQAALAVALFATLGPQWGTAILPTLGLNLMQTTVRKIVAVVSSYLPNLDNHDDTDDTQSTKADKKKNNKNDDTDGLDDLSDLIGNDYGSIPLSISTMSTGAEIHYQQYQRKQNQTKANKSSSSSSYTSQVVKRRSPLDLLRLGEVGYPISFGDLNNESPRNESDRNSTNVPVDRTGETTTTTSSTITTTTTTDGLPNPFILSEHWSSTIERMEQLMQQCRSAGNENDDDNAAVSSSSKYDPHSYRMEPPPKLIDDRFFPDLHIGWGDHVCCTHSQRQILYNRCLSTLLNRLAHNVHMNVTMTTDNKNDDDDDDRIHGDSHNYQNDTPSGKYFIVQISTTSTKELTTPYEFIQALIDHGHHVVTCIQTQPTTFGMALCVREANDTWTNIPFGYLLQTGLSDANGNEAYVGLPHSGLSLEISKGPLLLHHDDDGDSDDDDDDDSAKINIQHYMAIEGLCGWHSNHCANVPWIRSRTCSNTIRHNSHALESIQIATMQAIVMNTVGTKYDLPRGGYGLTGVCNDSAAQIECAMSPNGTTTHIYPLSFQGKFAMHTLRVANDIRQTLSSRCVKHTGVSSSIYDDDDNNDIENDMDDIRCLDRLIQDIISLPSDTNTTPISDMIHRCERYLHCCSWNGSEVTSSSLSSSNDHEITTDNDTTDLNNNINGDSTAATTRTRIRASPPPVFQLLVESCTIVESIRKELENMQTTTTESTTTATIP